MSLLDMLKESLFPAVNCDADQAEEPAADAEEEAQEAEDTMPGIQEACSETPICHPFKHHLEECTARVENGSDETCVEEFFHLQHCVDECAAPKIFRTLK